MDTSFGTHSATYGHWEEKFLPMTNRRKRPILRGGSVKRICRHWTIRSSRTDRLPSMESILVLLLHRIIEQRCNCEVGSTLFTDNAHICQENSIDEHFISRDRGKSSKVHAQVIPAVIWKVLYGVLDLFEFCIIHMLVSLLCIAGIQKCFFVRNWLLSY